MIIYGKRVVEYIIKKHPDIVKEILIAKKLNKRAYFISWNAGY